MKIDLFIVIKEMRKISKKMKKRKGGCELMLLKKCLMITLIAVIMVITVGCGSDGDKNLLDLVDEQLQGTWVSYDSDTVYSEWSFHNGQYVVDTYVNGEKLNNSTVGTYTIGTDAIHTVTIDQKENVEGSISYEYTDELILKSSTGKRIEKK